MEMISQNISALALALSKVQGIVGAIPKTKVAKVSSQRTGQTFSYSYADLADIWEAIRKPLSDNELAVTQLFVAELGKNYLQTMIIHSSGEWMKSLLELDSHEKIQELGSEITYLRRYGISSILGIVADEDEDGQAAHHSSKRAPIAQLPKNENAVVEKAKPPTLTKPQVEEIKKLIQNYPYIKEEVLKFTGKNLVQDIEYDKFQSVMNLIQLELNKQGVA
jgi:ERF superfamily protein